MWGLGQNWAGMDGRKKRKGIWVYQNDLLKKIKLEKRVMACSYGIMEFGTLHRNLTSNWQQACLCFIVEGLCDQHTIAAWNTPLFIILVRESSPGFQSPGPGFSFKSICIVFWERITLIIEKQTPPSLLLPQKIFTFFLNVETSSCSKDGEKWLVFLENTVFKICGRGSLFLYGKRGCYFSSDSGHYCNRNILIAIICRL